jgi:hypothetical protein
MIGEGERDMCVKRNSAPAAAGDLNDCVEHLLPMMRRRRESEGGDSDGRRRRGAPRANHCQRAACNACQSARSILVSQRRRSGGSTKAMRHEGAHACHGWLPDVSGGAYAMVLSRSAGVYALRYTT